MALMRLLVGTGAAILLCVLSLASATTRPARAIAVKDITRLVDIGGRKIYLQCRGSGSPTVILESGYRDRADPWSLNLFDVAGATMVLPGVAAFTRVCTYDRPGTAIVLDDVLRPARSDPVPMPRTAADVVAELNALLRAAKIPGPYVLVGHSFGGLFVRLYASVHPARVAGLVLVDALSEGVRARMTGDQWATYVRLAFIEAPPALAAYKDLETIDPGPASAAMAAARPLRRIPAVVLSKGKPFALAPDFPPALADALNAAWSAAQNELASRVHALRHTVAARSAHYIQLQQPELVTNAIEQVVQAVRHGVTIRCNGGKRSCRAKVRIGGGVTDRKVTIDLPATNLRQVGVRPARGLRGKYSLAAGHFGSGRRTYELTVSADQSVPAGSYLTVSFRRR
jgi:pimeloyl-ACP methyl ester carboxylesterase